MGFKFPRIQAVLSFNAFASDFNKLKHHLVDQIDLLKLAIYISNKDKILVFTKIAICKRLINSILLAVFPSVNLKVEKIRPLTFPKLRVSFNWLIEIAYRNIAEYELEDFPDLKM